MDEKGLRQILRDLDTHLTSSCDVVLVGGAAMILHFGATRATRDVDALFIGGDLSGMRQAIKAVAQERDLPDDWMNDSAKGFSDVLSPDFSARLVPLGINLKWLHLFALGLADQAAMKIVALREQDLEDLDLLLAKMSPDDRRTLVRIMNHLAPMRPDWAQKIRYFVLEQGWKIQS
jgi:uncharacterized nucleotidyltransferase DUF6036